MVEPSEPGGAAPKDAGLAAEPGGAAPATQAASGSPGAGRADRRVRAYGWSLLVAALVIFVGVSVTQSEAWRRLVAGAPPAAPTFPLHVVDDPGHPSDPGRLPGPGQVIWSVARTYEALISAHLGDAIFSYPASELEQHGLARHRSLELPHNALSDDVLFYSEHGDLMEPGLLAALVADAEAKGWRVMPGLTVDGGVVYQAVGLRQGGWLFLVLGFGDALAPVEGNPGANIGLTHDSHACCEGARCPKPSAPPEPAASGLAPCPVEGFVPVLVWTNLPEGSGAASSWLHPEAQGLAADGRAWADPPGWDEHVARAAGG
jgi:hypothetical protein